MPTSVRDAVLARTSQVTPHDFEVLQLVATAPDRLDDRVLPALGVDLPTLRRLDETALLTRTAEGIVFRHELARQAIESTVPPGGGPRLHALLLDALERVEPRDPAVLTHHAVGAHDAPRASRYAREAGQDATRAGSHSEAAAFFADRARASRLRRPARPGRAAPPAGLPAVHDQSAARGDRQRERDVSALGGGRRPRRAGRGAQRGRRLRVLQLTASAGRGSFGTGGSDRHRLRRRGGLRRCPHHPGLSRAHAERRATRL